MRNASARLVALFVIVVAALATPATAETPVDVEIVLAVDISMSMDVEEQRVQRDGYIAAITSPQVLKAISEGLHGSIALTYIEWAGAFEQRIVVPWRRIDGGDAAAAFARDLAVAPLRRVRRTSIAGVLDFSAPLFEGNGYLGMRRVIDVSGDGPNNQGRVVTEARDDALANGIVVNGLPLMFRTGGFMDIGRLDDYYRDCVIGGPGSFLLPVATLDDFAEAIRRKLVLEISDVAPPPRILPASDAPSVSCTIGEYLWEQRMRN